LVPPAWDLPVQISDMDDDSAINNRQYLDNFYKHVVSIMARVVIIVISAGRGLNHLHLLFGLLSQITENCDIHIVYDKCYARLIGAIPNGNLKWSHWPTLPATECEIIGYLSQQLNEGLSYEGHNFTVRKLIAMCCSRLFKGRIMKLEDTNVRCTVSLNPALTVFSLPSIAFGITEILLPVIEYSETACLVSVPLPGMKHVTVEGEDKILTIEASPMSYPSDIKVIFPSKCDKIQRHYIDLTQISILANARVVYNSNQYENGVVRISLLMYRY